MAPAFLPQALLGWQNGQQRAKRVGGQRPLAPTKHLHRKCGCLFATALAVLAKRTAAQAALALEFQNGTVGA